LLGGDHDGAGPEGFDLLLRNAAQYLPECGGSRFGGLLDFSPRATSEIVRKFFQLLGERMGDKCVLFLAEEDGHPLACALNLIGSEALYGRYWGRVADVPFLHFELCYYRAIDYAIEHKLAWVEAGAQGEHKVSRGYLPRPIYSGHWIADPNFRAGVSRFLESERREVAADIAAADGPFKEK